MPYRRDLSTLRSRARELEHRLDALHAAALRGADVAARSAGLRARLDRVRERLAAAPLPLAARVVAGRSCAARWDDLAGGDRVRTCPRCGQSVYDLADLPPDEAAALLERQAGRRVRRVLRRRDGTVTTRACRPRLGALALVLSAVFVAVGACPDGPPPARLAANAGPPPFTSVRAGDGSDDGVQGSRFGVLSVRVVPLVLDDAAYFEAINPPGPPERSVVRSPRAAHTRRASPRRAP